MCKGDVVLIPLAYTPEAHEDTEVKFVPVLIIGINADSVMVAFITTQIELQEDCDLILHPKKGNGLKKRSVVKVNKIITIDQNYIIGRLGTLSTREMRELNIRLLELFDLH